MKLEEKLTKLGFTQNPNIQKQRNNLKLGVNVYVETGKIVGVQIYQYYSLWSHILSDYDYSAYLIKVRKVIDKLNNILEGEKNEEKICKSKTHKERK